MLPRRQFVCGFPVVDVGGCSNMCCWADVGVGCRNLVPTTGDDAALTVVGR